MKRNIKRNEGQKSGVYKIINLINGKYYLGSSKHITSRYRTHLCTLKQNKSPCIILQKAINKYGIDNFEFIVVKITDDYKKLEIKLLDKEFPPYNIVKETKVRREISKESRLKMSLAKKGKPAHNKGKKRSKDFNVYRGMLVDIIENNQILFTGNIKECAKYLNMKHISLYTPLKNNSTVKCKYKLKKHGKT